MNDLTSGQGALICIPTYNEIENIGKIVPAVFDRVPEAHVLVIDDNSPDGTGDIADDLARENPNLHVLRREQKQGLGRAYQAGFAWGLEHGYKYFVEFDADFSHNPKYLPEFLEVFSRSDVVIGSRRVRGGGVENWSPMRRFISWGGSFYARMVLGIPIKDLTGGFNGFTREVLEKIDYQSISTPGFGFQIEIKYRCVKHGFNVSEFPIIFPDRVLGKSKMDSSIFLEAMLNVWKLRFGGKSQ